MNLGVCCNVPSNIFEYSQFGYLYPLHKELTFPNPCPKKKEEKKKKRKKDGWGEINLQYDWRTRLQGGAIFHNMQWLTEKAEEAVRD